MESDVRVDSSGHRDTRRRAVRTSRAAAEFGCDSALRSAARAGGHTCTALRRSDRPESAGRTRPASADILRTGGWGAVVSGLDGSVAAVRLVGRLGAVRDAGYRRYDGDIADRRPL